MIDPVEFGKAMGAMIREATAPLLRRIEELEAREPQSVAEPVADEVIARAVAEYLSRNPPAAGKDADPVSGDAIRDAVERHFAVNPPPAGKDADPVSESAIAGAVSRHLKENPPAPGKDAVAPTPDEVAACFERRFSEFLLSGERRIFDMADKAIERMPRPKDGLDGKDGLDLSHFSAVQEKGGRVVMLTLADGERTQHVHLHFPVVIDKGFYREGTPYEQGDGVTFGGSYWIAQKDTDTKPGIGSQDWRLAVKKGRDARGEKLS